MITRVEILLVEDSQTDADLTIRALKKGKIANEIVHVTNGVQALDYLFGTGEYENRNVEDKPKLILLDLKMPKLNGLEVLAKIKSSEITKTIPVVVLTSSKENPDIEKCYAAGANSYIVKPVDFDGFMEAIAHTGTYWFTFNQSLG